MNAPISHAAAALDKYRAAHTPPALLGAVPSSWPELQPLPEIADGNPDAFPLSALGAVLGLAATAIARDVQAPDAIVAGSVLATASLAAQPHANVVLPHSQHVPLSTYIVTSASSGDRKSATDAVSSAPIEEQRREDARESARKQRAYEDELANRDKGEPPPEPPKPRTLITSNTTIEGVMRLLKNQASVGIFSAEGGEILAGHSMRDERRAAALAFYLKGWNGETLDSLRGGNGLSVLLGRRIAMHVMVQPILLAGLLADPLAQGQGLLARCLIAQPQTLAGNRAYKCVDPFAAPEVTAFHDRINELLERKPAYWPEGDGWELDARDLPMDDDATKLWIAFYNQVEAEQADGYELAQARPFASKAAEHAARIAGILTLVNNPDASAIDDEAMACAIKVTTFYIREHLRLMGTSKEAQIARQLAVLWTWLRERGGIVSAADILQRTPRAVRNLKKDGIDPLLSELEQRGYIRPAAGGWEVRGDV